MKESPQYPIGTVARLSGFSTHQLRKWESRLGLLIPDRADNGRRYYTVQQLERLKILRRLINSGYRIGDDAISVGGNGVDSVQTLVAILHIGAEASEVAPPNRCSFGVSADVCAGE